VSGTAVFDTYARAPLTVDRGEGVWLYATDGRKYLDFSSGIAVNALGHAHPALIRALTDQAEKVWHTSNAYRIPGQELLAERLCALSGFADKVFFANSGAEAIECAIKTARRYHDVNGEPDRFRIITFAGSFHGRTLATLAAAKNPKHTDGFDPLPDGFDQVAFGDVDALKRTIGPQTAAIMVEPIQGEGGVRPISGTLMKELRRLCDDNGLLLILDEVQTGVGRTGRFFAFEWSGVKPDLLALAKGLGGGFPIGACLATAEAAKGMTPGTHGSTFGGNPLAMAVANAVLDVVLGHGFLEQVQRVSLYLKQRLASVVDSHPKVADQVRGEGLLIGIHVLPPNRDVLAAMRDADFLAVAAGDNVIRILPPLIATEADVDEAMRRIETAFERVEASAAA
jgi:acetylornithine/N-succinyldiaminopimelate aminotransferase